MPLPIHKRAAIQTERLTLKPYAPSDADALTALLTNPQITQTFMVPDYDLPEQFKALAQKLIAFSRIEDTAHLEYGVDLQDALIGFVNDCGIEDEEIEIGYVIHPDHQGQGCATEAVRALLRELRDMGFRKVTAGYFAENAASRRVLEKCGMHETDAAEEEVYRGKRHLCRYCEIEF